MNRSRWAVGVVALIATTMTGCVVGQRPGEGTCLYLREPSTGAAYWLYLPKPDEGDADAGGEPKKHPLVVTFHGMKPFDDAHRQIREWQQEADRYGFVVCAPELLVADLFGPLPLSRKDHPSLQRDEKNVIAIMNHVYKTADVDPNHVLATSWSYGGYVAHYMANQYPERFHCIAVKQSNFNANLLDPANVPRYRDRKVAIYYTENDFAICRKESRQAAEWYAKHGFDLTCGVFEKKGHERTPGVAAEFFARVCGIEAKSPPVELASMQIKLEHVGPSQPEPVGKFVPGVAASRTAERSESAPVEIAAVARPLSLRRNSGRRRLGAARSNPSRQGTGRGVPLRSKPVLSHEKNRREQRDETVVRRPKRGVVRIRVSSTIGVAPLLVSYSAVIPKSLREGASLLWTHNGQPLSNGLNGQKVLSEPGDHTIELSLTAADGTEYQAVRIINVIERTGHRQR